MALIDQLPEGAHVALDTDAIIYYVEEHDRFLPVIEPLIEAVEAGRLTAHISVISLIEVLVRPLRDHRHDLADSYRDILLHSRVAQLHTIDPATAQRAAAIRADFRLPTPDALIAALTLVTGCNALITNNAGDFRRVEGLRVLGINDFA